MSQESVRIICKHVSSGCNISPIKLNYQDALNLSMSEFCFMLNKKMLKLMHKYNTPSIQDSNGSYPYDIIYSDDGENNINKKLPLNEPVPFMRFLSKQKKIYNIYNLSFYARDNSVYEPTYTNIEEEVEQAAEPENQCCVCFNTTTVSCSEFYSCGNNMHHICRQCYNTCRNTSYNRCPICRAEPHATAYMTVY